MTPCPTPGCPFRSGHPGECLPAPHPVSVLDARPDVDDTLPAPEDRCVHCGGWGCFDFGDSEGQCGHCDGTGLEPR